MLDTRYVGPPDSECTDHVELSCSNCKAIEQYKWTWDTNESEDGFYNRIRNEFRTRHCNCNEFNVMPTFHYKLPSTTHKVLHKPGYRYDTLCNCGHPENNHKSGEKCSKCSCIFYRSSGIVEENKF